MSEEKSSRFSGVVTKLGLQPLEAPTLVAHGNKRLQIGLPRERSFDEHRIALTPDSVRTLVNQGHEILIESDAGKDCSFFNNEFSEAGAEITNDVEKVFKSDIIIKVAPLVMEEIDMLATHQTIISSIHLPTIKKPYIDKLMQKKVTALAFEYIQDSAGFFPFVRSMSEIAGNSVILIAAEYLSTISGGKGLLLGGISGVPPTKVVILGAGVVGTNAANAALGLGSIVSVFDDNVYKLMRLQNELGTRIFTSVILPDILIKELVTADVAIGAIHSKEGRTPMIVPETMVQQMKPGSVVIDVSIDQGGCFETSEVRYHDNPSFRKFGVIHYCVPNIPSRFARTASQAFSNILTPVLSRTGKMGGFKNLLYEDAGIRHGVYLYKGNLTNVHLSNKFDLKMSNLELLFAANY
ncbi:MAG: alanine dehydrogenase [Chitinophagales bacterium]|nr:alanine dehydrogenase [Chitinophagales bacterium]